MKFQLNSQQIKPSSSLKWLNVIEFSKKINQPKQKLAFIKLITNFKMRFKIFPAIVA
jgi:hypothetical protein